jgi:hypothetical protein
METAERPPGGGGVIRVHLGQPGRPAAAGSVVGTAGIDQRQQHIDGPCSEVQFLTIGQQHPVASVQSEAAKLDDVAVSRQGTRSSPD